DSFSFSGTNFIIYPPGGGTVKIQAKDISIGHRPAGATVIPNIWVLHKTSGRPYKYGNPGSFTFVLKDSGLPPGLKLVRIDADPHQGAAAVDENGGIWVADVNSYWRLANGYASDVAIGGGYIWVIGSEPGPGGYRIYRAPFAIGRSNFSWQSMNGHGMKIDAGGDGCAWTINDSYQVWEYAANSQGHIGWQDRNFHAIDVAVSQTNRAWFTGFDYAENVPFSSDGGRLWVYNIPDAITGGAAGKPIWEVLDGRGDTIGAGDGTGVWVVDANGDIRAGSGRIGQGNAGNGYFACR
ncbi:MAG: hypothetical protein OIF38_15150, partial [Cellvibrionaceae bacterium]|nr:hypothetical protein [Cellvibrionaceae bacterium]